MPLPNHPLDPVPLWALYLITIGLLLLATEVGFRTGLARQKRDPEKDTAIGPMVAATLGLVGFLLAVITSMAGDRFDTRRRLVLEEANTIGTAYLRAGYLPEPYAAESRDLIREYVDARLGIAADVEAAIARSEEIQIELWQRVEALVEATGGSDVYALYVESVTELVELHHQREIAGVYARLPGTLLIGLLGFTILGMFILGLGNSYDRRRSTIALVSLILVFGSAFYLILDLDRSREGFFQVSDQPLISLQERLSP